MGDAPSPADGNKPLPCQKQGGYFFFIVETSHEAEAPPPAHCVCHLPRFGGGG